MTTDFENEKKLIGDGILESFDIMSLVAELEDEFGVTASKTFFKNRRQPIIQVRPSIPPSNYHPPGGAHLGRANVPAAAPVPGRSEDQAQSDETILHG